jgi:thiol-disulfide isomerase/thioredoxin
MLAAWFALLAASGAQAMAVGDVAPAFARDDLSGKPVDLPSLRGKLVLLNFWATWCAPCREEMPAFSQWQRRYRAQGLRVVGISMDDDAASVRAFLAKRPVAYPVVMGDAALGERFGGVLGLPLSYLVDAQGRVVARYQGEADLAAMEAKLKELLPG